MPTIALQPFREMLGRGRVSVINEEVSNLLDLLQARDAAMRSADQLEATMVATIGYPRLIVEVDKTVRAVTSHEGLQQLVDEGKLTEADCEWLGRRLARRQGQWWQQSSELGLRGQRRRERRSAALAAQLANRILSARSTTLSEIATKVALLAATQTPARKHLVGLLDDLATLQ